jgi:hypothetical protein
MFLPSLLTPPPYEIENVKPALAYLQRNWRQGDQLYVYYGAGPALSFYGAQYGLTKATYLQGQCHRGDTRQYLSELERFRGQSRVWIFVTHACPRFGERDSIIRYLETIGVRVDARTFASRTVSSVEPAEVLLYDLSEPEHLSRASASKFPLLGRNDPRTCDYGPQSMLGSL